MSTLYGLKHLSGYLGMKAFFIGLFLDHKSSLKVVPEHDGKGTGSGNYLAFTERVEYKSWKPAKFTDRSSCPPA
jgi:hypothetical protein